MSNYLVGSLLLLLLVGVAYSLYSYYATRMNPCYRDVRRRPYVDLKDTLDEFEPIEPVKAQSVRDTLAIIANEVGCDVRQLRLSDIPSIDYAMTRDQFLTESAIDALFVGVRAHRDDISFSLNVTLKELVLYIVDNSVMLNRP
jgi:hypothetical protein